jgi:hypothetical protein
MWEQPHCLLREIVSDPRRAVRQWIAMSIDATLVHLIDNQPGDTERVHCGDGGLDRRLFREQREF